MTPVVTERQRRRELMQSWSDVIAALTPERRARMYARRRELLGSPNLTQAPLGDLITLVAEAEEQARLQAVDVMDGLA